MTATEAMLQPCLSHCKHAAGTKTVQVPKEYNVFGNKGSTWEEGAW